MNEGPSSSARRFAARLSHVESPDERAELRDRFEEICQRAVAYEGCAYNGRAEHRAYDAVAIELTRRGH